MDPVQILTFFKDHLLAVIAVILTLVFVYHYIIEKEHGIKLSKKYRNKIFETQSKIFLNATQYLISGNKNQAIKEFLNATDLNGETLDTYFALGGLFRSNGEIDKAIEIHRSLIARENISEASRLKALKELAIDFDKGGFVDKAIETYKDVLKINRDQYEVIESLCNIYENVGDWDQAYQYRIMLSKVGHENQSETISHILVEKAKEHFNSQAYKECLEDLDDAFRFAPSVSAKILKLKTYLVQAKQEEAQNLLREVLLEHPMYASFIFVSLDEYLSDNRMDDYNSRLNKLKDYFLSFDDKELAHSPSIVLTQVRLLKSQEKNEQAFNILAEWLKQNQNDALKVEYLKLLIILNKKEEALDATNEFIASLNKSLTRHYCSQCGFNSDDIFWRCPQCHRWETIQFRWKV